MLDHCFVATGFNENFLQMLEHCFCGYVIQWQLSPNVGPLLCGYMIVLFGVCYIWYLNFCSSWRVCVAALRKSHAESHCEEVWSWKVEPRSRKAYSTITIVGTGWDALALHSRLQVHEGVQEGVNYTLNYALKPPRTDMWQPRHSPHQPSRSWYYWG